MTTKAKTPAAKPATKKPVAKPAKQDVVNNTPATEPTAAPTAPTKPKKDAAPKREQQNGVARPGEGTTCRAIWDACDAIKAAGQDITFASLAEKLPNVNPATLRTQRQRHRTYLGLNA